MASAGYSGTPLAKKLGIPAGRIVELHHPPAGFRALLGEVPPGVTFREATRASPKRRAGRATSKGADRPALVHFFTKDSAQLAAALPELARSIHPDATLWVSWPKKSSGVATDVTEDRIRELALPIGIVDVKVCAIDETWSGLKLVWRKTRR